MSEENSAPAPAPRPQHLLISGGGYVGGYALYGAIRETHRQNRWNINEIKSISAVSVGTMIAAVLALKPDWETIDTYLIQRPWGAFIQMDKLDVFGLITRMGVLDKTFFIDAIAPFFRANDIDINITFREFCDKTNIQLYFYCTEIYSYQMVCMSRETTPDLPIIDAIYRSSCLPIIFVPEYTEDVFYLDGGLISNYPTDLVLQRVGDAAQVMGFVFSEKRIKINIKNVLDMLLCIISTIFYFVINKPSKLANEVSMFGSNAENTLEMLKSAELRREIIETGAAAAQNIL
jgi:predicted acylesterase/phospholipase RssA